MSVHDMNTIHKPFVMTASTPPLHSLTSPMCPNLSHHGTYKFPFPQTPRNQNKSSTTNPSSTKTPSTPRPPRTTPAPPIKPTRIAMCRKVTNLHTCGCATFTLIGCGKNCPNPKPDENASAGVCADCLERWEKAQEEKAKAARRGGGRA